ncbi:MAG: hypothetical protein M0C28_11790 [Candidatus Moduliflexus flocculans]|nr:hypothetical protein [Candidatus Moduliflexus flocculans]
MSNAPRLQPKFGTMRSVHRCAPPPLPRNGRHSARRSSEIVGYRRHRAPSGVAAGCVDRNGRAL